MKYNIVKFILNAQDQYSASISATFDNLEKAVVNYHSTLAALHNESTVKTACVKIEDMYGKDIKGYIEMVNHNTTTE